MSKIRPLSRRDLIKKLKDLGWEGPFSGTRHEYMKKDLEKVFIPNPHSNKDIGVPLLVRIAKQIRVDINELQ